MQDALSYVEGLSAYRKLGPPKLPRPMMSWKDVEFSYSVCRGDIEDVVGEGASDGLLAEDEKTVDITDQKPIADTLQCNSCGRDFVDCSDVEETLEILSNVEVVGDVGVSPCDAEDAVNNAYIMYI